MRARWSAAALLALLAAGCELAEVATPEGRDLLVVEAVLRAGADRQMVLLHRSLNGSVVRGEPGARVVVRDSVGQEVEFEELPSSDSCTRGLFVDRVDSLVVAPTCYRALALDVVPRRVYELRVQARDGRVVRGRTRVPGEYDLRVPPVPASGPRVCALQPATNLELVWSRSQGAWSYLISAEIVGLRAAFRRQGIEVDAPDQLELTGLAISERDTTLVLPAQLGIFERAELDQDLLRLLQGGFPSGVAVELVVAAADRNLVNGVRGGGFNPSGNVRISSVVGDGVGVFGSVVPRGLVLMVDPEAPYPPCR